MEFYRCNSLVLRWKAENCTYAFRPLFPVKSCSDRTLRDSWSASRTGAWKCNSSRIQRRAEWEIHLFRGTTDWFLIINKMQMLGFLLISQYLTNFKVARCGSSQIRNGREQAQSLFDEHIADGELGQIVEGNVFGVRQMNRPEFVEQNFLILGIHGQHQHDEGRCRGRRFVSLNSRENIKPISSHWNKCIKKSIFSQPTAQCSSRSGRPAAKMSYRRRPASKRDQWRYAFPCRKSYLRRTFAWTFSHSTEELCTCDRLSINIHKSNHH